jgi:hypothetical protein
MYTWVVSFDSAGIEVDQGIWLTTSAGATWKAIDDTGITICGDGIDSGCGVQQGSYNLELAAVPNGSTATDLYAGAVNIFKCTVASPTSSAPACTFLNLTYVYGCSPTSALAHLHPDQHALDFALAGTPTQSLLYFANDGGVYRALDGYTGLTTGSCSGHNSFESLNGTLGSMTQFVSFSSHGSHSGDGNSNYHCNSDRSVVETSPGPQRRGILTAIPRYSALATHVSL